MLSIIKCNSNRKSLFYLIYLFNFINLIRLNSEFFKISNCIYACTFLETKTILLFAYVSTDKSAKLSYSSNFFYAMCLVFIDLKTAVYIVFRIVNCKVLNVVVIMLEEVRFL